MTFVPWPEWLADSLSWSSTTIGAFVPSGFDVYACLPHASVGEIRFDDASGSWLLAPGDGVGSIPPDLFRSLCECLTGDAGSADSVWAMFWNGLEAERVGHFMGAYTLPFLRDCSAYRTSLEELRVMVTEHRADGLYCSPTLWWDECRTWCVATDVDWPFTLIGCTGAINNRLSTRCNQMLLPVLWNDPLPRTLV